jgi:hypothetical protein
MGHRAGGFCKEVRFGEVGIIHFERKLEKVASGFLKEL